MDDETLRLAVSWFPHPGSQAVGDGRGTALDMDRWFPEDVKRVSRDGEGGKKERRYRV